MIVLIGKSGSGKSTIERELVKHGYEKIVSYTTRKKRDNEIDGVHYNFVTEEKFKELVGEGHFAEYVTYENCYYGAAKKDCIDGKVIVVEKNALIQLKKNGVKMKSFYVDVDVETRYHRMISDNRGLPHKAILSRIENDGAAFEGIEREVDHIVENKELYKCVKEILNQVDEAPKKQDL